MKARYSRCRRDHRRQCAARCHGTNPVNSLFPERHPHAGGPDHYAAYLANTDGFEAELVSDSAT